MSSPELSAAAWRAARIAAERAIPRLISRGYLEIATNLSRRAAQFAEREARAEART